MAVPFILMKFTLDPSVQKRLEALQGKVRKKFLKAALDEATLPLVGELRAVVNKNTGWLARSMSRKSKVLLTRGRAWVITGPRRNRIKSFPQPNVIFRQVGGKPGKTQIIHLRRPKKPGSKSALWLAANPTFKRWASKYMHLIERGAPRLKPARKAYGVLARLQAKYQRQAQAVFAGRLEQLLTEGA